MACFIVPATEAIITTTVAHVAKKKAEKEGKTVTTDNVVPFYKKLGWLNKMLWGGSFLLAFEHVWHGEVVPWFPFLTAMESAESTAEMLGEMSTVGVGMAVLVTGVWAAMVAASTYITKKQTAAVKE